MFELYIPGEHIDFALHACFIYPYLIMSDMIATLEHPEEMVLEPLSSVKKFFILTDELCYFLTVHPREEQQNNKQEKVKKK